MLSLFYSPFILSSHKKTALGALKVRVHKKRFLTQKFHTFPWLQTKRLNGETYFLENINPMEDFKRMLSQCEKQAEKLIRMEVNDNFFRELDIFDGYFSQLRQIIDGSAGKISRASAQKLLSLINAFGEKIETRRDDILKEAKNAGKNIAARGYSHSKYQEALKFDKRS